MLAFRQKFMEIFYLQKSEDMMRLSCILVVCVMLFSGIASAQEPVRYVEQYNEVSDGKVVPHFTSYVEGPIKGTIGWAGWLWVQKDWAEGMGGLTYAPKSWIQIAGMIGAEKDARPLRGAANLWLSSSGWTFEVSHEYGGSGHWARYRGYYKPRKIGVGVDSTKFVGTGPYVEADLGKITLYGSYAIVKSGGRGIFGARLNF